MNALTFKVTTVRLPEETLEALEDLTNKLQRERSDIMREAMKIGIGEMTLRLALELYRSGKCTLWKAAQQADLNIREMMDLATREKIPVHITPEDVDEAWREALDE